MIRQTKRVPSEPARLARGEAAAAWDHLVAAAEHGRRRVGDSSRRTGQAARDRASNAAKALRGERPASPWRWLGIGLAAGAAMAAAAAAVVARRQDAMEEQLRQATGTVREKANTAVEAIRERTGSAAHRAASTARDTATRAREAARARGHGNGQPDGDGTKPLRDPDHHAAVE